MRYHKGNDIRIITEVSGFAFSEVANFFVLIEHENGVIVKQFAVGDNPDFNTSDRTVIDDTHIEVRLLAHETSEWNLGKYVARLMVAHNDAAFEGAVRLESDSQHAFHLVSDIETTELSERVLTFYGYSVNSDTPQASPETPASIKNKYESNGDTNAFNDATKAKVAGIEAEANKYVHPANHAASMITEETDKRFMLDAERLKLGNVEAGANKYVHPASHTASEVTEETDKRFMLDAEKTKVAGIEAGAQVNRTAAEVKTAYEGNTNTNAFTDAEKSKLAGLESAKFKGTYLTLAALEAAHPTAEEGSNAHVDAGAGSDVQEYIWDNDDSKWVQATGGTTAETAASVKTKYESNPDTNAFDDATKAKVAGIEAGANKYVHPVNHAASEITEETDKRFMLDAERLKLGNVEAGANKYVHPASHTASEVTEETDKRFMLDAERLKLGNVEAEANKYVHPASHTASEVTEETDKRFMLDAERLKLGNVEAEANKYVHPLSHPASIIVQDANNRFTTDAEKTKVAGIEAGAQVNRTAAEVKTAYEGNANTNAFTDAEKSKLAGLESAKFKGTYLTLAALEAAHPTAEEGSNAHVDAGAGNDVQEYIWDNDDGKWVQATGGTTAETAASIKTKYESNPDTNTFDDATKAKVAGIEAEANKYVHPANHAASEITEDASRRFVSDTEKSTWNNKLGSGDVGAMAAKGFWSGTQTAYDALTPNANTLYFITE